MLVKFLSQADKEHLLDLAELLSLADNPLLWDGKRKEEITSETNLNNLSIQVVERESALIAELRSEGEKITSYRSSSDLISNIAAISRGVGSFSTCSAVEESLIKKLKTLPIHAAEEPANRAEAAKAVMKNLLEGKRFELPSVPKLMMFELMSMALCDGSISSIEWALLKEFQHHHQLEDFVFDEILERAEIMNTEVSKTIAIILE